MSGGGGGLHRRGPSGGQGADRGRGTSGRPSRRRRGTDTSALLDAIFPDEPQAAEGPDDARTPWRDLQSLLTEAVQDLVRRTAADHACAWLAREDGTVLPVAALRRRGDPADPDAEAFEVLRRLGRPTDLGEPGLDPCLARLAAEAGLAAAIPFAADGTRVGEPAQGVLLIGGRDDLPGRVRPRSLALLGEAAEALSRPLASAGAVTRLDQLDVSVQRLDRLASLGELLTEIVHEVRNPLVSVKTFLQLLPDRQNDPEFLGDFRLLVADEVTRLERLLDSVLWHAAPDHRARHREEADVRESFEAILQLLAHRARERHVELSHEIEPNVGEVAMERDALRQVLLNLTLNAIDATPAQAGVDLTARRQADADGRWIEILVDDGGTGIATADRARVFEAFFSSREQRPGGLGLSISKRLVEAAGGTIEVSESPTGGARFRLQIPARSGQIRR